MYTLLKFYILIICGFFYKRILECFIIYKFTNMCIWILGKWKMHIYNIPSAGGVSWDIWKSIVDIVYCHFG